MPMCTNMAYHQPYSNRWERRVQEIGIKNKVIKVDVTAKNEKN